MQESVMSVECIPWTVFFAAFQDGKGLALKQGKEIELKVEGETPSWTEYY